MHLMILVMMMMRVKMKMTTIDAAHASDGEGDDDDGDGDYYNVADELDDDYYCYTVDDENAYSDVKLNLIHSINWIQI